MDGNNMRFALHSCRPRTDWRQVPNELRYSLCSIDGRQVFSTLELLSLGIHQVRVPTYLPASRRGLGGEELNAGVQQAGPVSTGNTTARVELSMRIARMG